MLLLSFRSKFSNFPVNILSKQLELSSQPISIYFICSYFLTKKNYFWKFSNTYSVHLKTKVKIVKNKEI